MITAASIMAILGALDDIFDLDWTLKLAGQFVAAGILAWQGVQIVSLPIGGITIGSFGMSFVVSVFLTVLIMNAVNFIDGLDGLGGPYRYQHFLYLQLFVGAKNHTE